MLLWGLNLHSMKKSFLSLLSLLVLVCIPTAAAASKTVNARFDSPSANNGTLSTSNTPIVWNDDNPKATCKSYQLTFTVGKTGSKTGNHVIFSTSRDGNSSREVGIAYNSSDAVHKNEPTFMLCSILYGVPTPLNAERLNARKGHTYVLSYDSMGKQFYLHDRSAFAEAQKKDVNSQEMNYTISARWNDAAQAALKNHQSSFWTSGGTVHFRNTSVHPVTVRDLTGLSKADFEKELFGDDSGASSRFSAPTLLLLIALLLGASSILLLRKKKQPEL